MIRYENFRKTRMKLQLKKCRFDVQKMMRNVFLEFLSTRSIQFFFLLYDA